MPSVRSYLKVNYSLRPSKHVERKMLVESFRRLRHIDALENYRYVGFGSPFFSDFSLIHKQLNISDCISIEHDNEDKPRFLHNSPFRGVTLAFGEAIEILPELDWTPRTILWLDYDEKLSDEVLVDVRTFFLNAVSGSVIIITLDAEPVELDKRVQEFAKNLAAAKVPRDLTNARLGEWGTAEASFRVVNNEIREVLQLRNLGQSRGQEFVYEQLYNFQYADGHKMASFGGILYEAQHEDLIRECAFGSLPFIRPAGMEALRIEVPSLTLKEMRMLDRFLPGNYPDDANLEGVPPEDAQKYAGLYRYFPSFVDADF